nr:immunoglobulin light chain junction region [Macaca mulatta]MOW17559.1 immunoglobulin light chain junction region [Macaca mulatta]MOW18087.1 immunoglobulin light chain junction region [Macaca mulatta]
EYYCSSYTRSNTFIF